jgi:hypothetical protein
MQQVSSRMLSRSYFNIIATPVQSFDVQGTQEFMRSLDGTLTWIKSGNPTSTIPPSDDAVSKEIRNARKMLSSQERVVVQAQDEFLKMSLNAVPSPDGRKIALFYPSDACSGGAFFTPMYIYDNGANTLTVVVGSSFSEFFWQDNDRILFSGGMISSIDLKSGIVKPLFHDSWIEKKFRCPTESSGNPSRDTLCDHDEEYFNYAPMLVSCDA